jgi:hypothetical protein
MATSESITAAMEAINTLAVWLEDAGLDYSAIAQFKYNALVQRGRNNPPVQVASG